MGRRAAHRGRCRGLQLPGLAHCLQCGNDLAQLLYAPGQAAGTCLSAVQLAAVQALRDPRAMGVPFASGITRFPGFSVTGDEDGTGWQWPFYPIGTETPSRPLPPGMGFEPLTMSAEYLGSVTARLGQQIVDGLMRLYVPAGSSHNVGGASQINALAMLEDRVLRDRTPPDAPLARTWGWTTCTSSARCRPADFRLTRGTTA